MKKLFLLLLIIPHWCSAQLIVDFGIGMQGGVFRFSEDRSFYEGDSVKSPNFNLEESENFFVKPGDGASIGITVMAACTLTSPDQRIFFTLTTRPSIGYASFQQYTPSYNSSLIPPDIEWHRDSLNPNRAGIMSWPVLGHLNFNLNEKGDAVYFGAGLSVNIVRVDGRKEFNRVPVIIVGDQTGFPGRVDSYHGFYHFDPFYKAEAQIGFIWSGPGDRQHEAYIAGSMGKGKQGSVLIGYLWRFNFYRG